MTKVDAMRNDGTLGRTQHELMWWHAYEQLDRVTGTLINGILAAARDAGHEVCGSHIGGERTCLGCRCCCCGTGLATWVDFIRACGQVAGGHS